MTEQALRPGSVAVAAVAIGGAAAVAMPQHAVTIGQLAVVTIAAAAGLHVLAVIGDEAGAAGWLVSPFRGAADPESANRRSADLDRIRATFKARRNRLDHGPPMPLETLRLLQPLIRSALQREGLDPRSPAHLAAARRRLSPMTMAVLNANSDPLDQPGWLGSYRPNPRAVAAVVHRVLDDIEDV